MYEKRKNIVEKFIEETDFAKKYENIPLNELKILRLILKLELIKQNVKPDGDIFIQTVKVCNIGVYNLLEYIASYRNRVDLNRVSNYIKDTKILEQDTCENCPFKTCFERRCIKLIRATNKYRKVKQIDISPLDVVEYFIELKESENNEIKVESPNIKVIKDTFFYGMNPIALIYIYIILEAQLVRIKSIQDEKLTIEYLDITKKLNDEFYVELLSRFYANKKCKNVKTLKIDLKKLESYLDNDDIIKVSFIFAGYYLYLEQEQGVSITHTLGKITEESNLMSNIKVRVHFFVYKYFQRLEELPYSDKTKDKIYKILNYILNFRYQKSTPFIPINLVIYSNDKEGIEEICTILGEFMWFFGYLSDKKEYYNEYMNKIILDRYLIDKIYYEKTRPKQGMLLINNFENLAYCETNQRNSILNILTDEMEKNNRNVCTVIYGEKKIVKSLIENNPKLSQMLINIELEIDDLTVDEVFNQIIHKLERYVVPDKQTKDKLMRYIKATYCQSDIKNMEYVKNLYDNIILNMNSKFEIGKTLELTPDAIPDAYNTKDLPEVMKDLNKLVGLVEIKEQLKDLISLLNFNKKAQIDIADFNLHMIFSGNPGTGKTTVARLLTQILYSLGYITKNKLTEVSAKDLIAEYVGQTSGKTYKVFQNALGGILFIDEAYSITSTITGSNNFGQECIATLLKLMEDYKDKIIIIFAGYEEEMKEFKLANPGLVSRIGYNINFPDFSIDELMKIYLNLLEDNNLKITSDAKEKLKDVITKASSAKNFGNGRYINNAFQKILIEHSKNVKLDDDENLYLITKDDINEKKLIVEDDKKKIGF